MKEHYKSQLLSQVYTILGSFEFLGSPLSLVNNLGTGVYDFFYEPAQGLVKVIIPCFAFCPSPPRASRLGPAQCLTCSLFVRLFVCSFVRLLSGAGRPARVRQGRGQGHRLPRGQFRPGRLQLGRQGTHTQFGQCCSAARVPRCSTDHCPADSHTRHNSSRAVWGEEPPRCRSTRTTCANARRPREINRVTPPRA